MLMLVCGLLGVSGAGYVVVVEHARQAVWAEGEQNLLRLLEREARYLAADQMSDAALGGLAAQTGILGVRLWDDQHRVLASSPHASTQELPPAESPSLAAGAPTLTRRGEVLVGAAQLPRLWGTPSHPKRGGWLVIEQNLAPNLHLAQVRSRSTILWLLVAPCLLAVFLWRYAEHFMARPATRVKDLEPPSREPAAPPTLAAQASQPGLFDWDLRTDQLYTSPQLHQLLGYEDGALPKTGLGFYQACYDPRDVASPLEALLAEPLPAATSGFSKLGLRLRTPTGRWLLMDLHAVCVRDEANQIVRITGAIATQVESAVGASERTQAHALSHTAMEGLDSGLLFLDAEDRVIFCNSRYRQMYDIPPSLPLQGLQFSEVVRWGFEHHADELFGRTLDAAVAERMALHRVKTEPWEIHLRKLQRWVLASDRPTLDGGVVCLRTDITALKTTEAGLQEHTELLDLAIFSSSAGLCHWERSTGELQLTPVFLALLGAAENTLPRTLGRFIGRCVHPDDRQAVWTTLTALVGDPTHAPTYRHELRLWHATGAWRWFTLRLAVRRDAAGQAYRAAGWLVDHHARKSREEELARTRQQLTDAIESLDMGLVMYDAQQHFVLSNQRYLKMFTGENVQLVPGESLDTALRQQDKQHPSLLDDTALAARGAERAAMLHIEHGRTARQVGARWLQSDHYTTPAGGWVALYSDITTVKHAELALRASEARLQTIFENAPMGIFLADPQGHVSFHNLAYQQITSPAHGGDDDWLGQVHPADHARVSRRWAEYVLAPEGQLDLEYRVLCETGPERQVRRRASPVRAGEQVLGFGGTTEDVTQQRQAEVAERESLTQAEQAKKTVAIAQLTAGVAHDFNNMLASLLGYTALANTRPAVSDDTKLRDYLHAIQLAGERARDLVAKLQIFGRPPPLTNLPVGVTAVLPQLNAITEFLRTCLPTTTRLVTDFEPDLPGIAMGHAEMRQVILNLALNARDAISGAGQMCVTAHRLRRLTDRCASCSEVFDDAFIEISISDTGCGIAPEHLQRIFEPFFSTKPVGQDTGMGLCVAHGLVHTAGGHLLVESHPGAGTRLRLLLRPAPDSPSAATPSAATIPPPSSPSGNILVVDDTPDLVSLWQTALSAKGYGVMGFTDPQQAYVWALANPTEYQLLLTDQNMPGMTGLELAREILARRPNLPVILCSGLLEPAQTQQARVLGLRCVLAKPAPLGELLRVVAGALNETTPESAARG